MAHFAGQNCDVATCAVAVSHHGTHAVTNQQTAPVLRLSCFPGDRPVNNWAGEQLAWREAAVHAVPALSGDATDRLVKQVE